MKDGYRSAATVPVEPPGNDSLTCYLIDGDRHRWARLVYVKAGVIVFGCALVSNAGVGWVLLVLVLGALWIRADVRQRKGVGVVFQVRNRRLNVRRPGTTDIDVSLERLHDVRLDTKASSRDLTISRSDGVNSAFGMSSGHSIEFDVSRIEMITASETILLSPEFCSHSLSTDELRSIRRFLRAKGWVPLDERQA